MSGPTLHILLAGLRTADSNMKLETEAIARALVERLGGRWHGYYGVCRCPAHEDRSPSLRIAGGNRTILVHCFAGCRRQDVLRALPFVDRDDVASAISSNSSRFGKRWLNLALIPRLWNEGRAIQGTAAERYLERRGIEATSRALRFHPRMFAGPRRQGASFPALMAAIETDEGVIALQRTFLTADGRKAPLYEPRRTLGSPGIGAIRLSPPDAAGRLGLAEGTETALSAAAIFGLPVWATAGSEGFGKVAIPERVRELHLFLDNGKGGDRAEALVRMRNIPATVHSHRPHARFGDWNDVAQDEMVREERGNAEGAR